MLYVAMTRASTAWRCRRCSRQLGPGSWWNRLALLVTEVDLQAQAPAAHGAEAAAPADVPETFTIPSLPALPEALPNRPRAHRRRAGGRCPVAMPGDAESTPLSRRGDAMHQLLEQAGVAGAPLADVRAHGWPAAPGPPGC